MNFKEELNKNVTIIKDQRKSNTFTPQTYVRRYYPDSVLYGPTIDTKITQDSTEK